MLARVINTKYSSNVCNFRKRGFCFWDTPRCVKTFCEFLQYSSSFLQGCIYEAFPNEMGVYPHPKKSRIARKNVSASRAVHTSLRNFLAPDLLVA